MNRHVQDFVLFGWGSRPPYHPLSFRHANLSTYGRLYPGVFCSIFCSLLLFLLCYFSFLFFFSSFTILSFFFCSSVIFFFCFFPSVFFCSYHHFFIFSFFPYYPFFFSCLVPRSSRTPCARCSSSSSGASEFARWSTPKSLPASRNPATNPARRRRTKTIFNRRPN